MDGKVIVTRIDNIFDPLVHRTIREMPAGMSLAHYVAECFPGVDPADAAVALDGHIVHHDDYGRCCAPGQSLALYVIPRGGGGGGKNILRTVAMLAVMVASVATGQWYLAAQNVTLATATAGQLAMAAGISGITSVAGGMIVNAVLPPVQADPISAIPSGFSRSATYGWDVQGNPVQEGGPWPVLYGTARITPPTIGRYVDAEGDDQYLNVLYLVADHAVDGMSGIVINSTPIDHYAGVTCEARYGGLDQAPLQYFTDTRTDVPVGAQVGADWVTRRTQGNVVEGLGIGISLPGGLFYANDAGGLSQTTVKLDIEYRMVGDVEWTRLTGHNATDLVVAADRWSGGYYESNRWVELEAGSTDPEAHREGDPYQPSPGSFQFIIADPMGRQTTPPRPNYIWRWLLQQATVKGPGEVETEYIEIIGAQSEPLRRALYRDRLPAGQYDIRIRFHDGTPPAAGSRYSNDVWFDYCQEIIYDDFEYPGASLLAVRALATAQLSGNMPLLTLIASRNTVSVPVDGETWEDRPANNPAWATLDALVSKDYGGEVAPWRIGFGAWERWAALCLERGWECHIYFDVISSLRSALDMIATLGRGRVGQMGSRFTCHFDGPDEMPAQGFLFTPGNIARDSFVEEWLPRDGRADALEITYHDAELDYARQTLEVRTAGYAASERESQPAAVTLIGCTSRTQAIKHGKYLLNCNRYLTLTASWDADIDALACVVGDVVDVAHDRPQWGYGGRIVAADEYSITIDRDDVPIDGAGTWMVSIKGADDLRQARYVDVEASDGPVVAITEAWDPVPEKYDLYSLGIVDRVTQPMRIKRITRAADGRRRLAALEYNESVYSDAGDIALPVPVSDLAMTAGLQAVEVWRGGTGTQAMLSWRGAAMKWRVWHRVSGPWILFGEVYRGGCEISGLAYGPQYEFAVSHTANPADGETAFLVMDGKTSIVPQPADLYAAIERGGIRISWQHISPVERYAYKLKVGSDWPSGQTLIEGHVDDFLWNQRVAGSYTFWLSAIDAQGNKSIPLTTTVVIEPPTQVSLLSEFIVGDVQLFWSVSTGPWPVEEYRVLVGEELETADVVDQVRAQTLTIPVGWSGPRRFWVQPVDEAGNLGDASGIDVVVVAPGEVQRLRAQTIDNYALVYWEPPATGSLPVAYYRLLKGATIGVATEIGRVGGTFHTPFESAAGEYLYWVIPVDTAGNEGPERSVRANITAPPDYVLLADWEDDFSGDLDNVLVRPGRGIYAPVAAGQTWAQHFTSNGWTTIRDQIDAGYPLYLQPAAGTGQYERVFDYGEIISGTKISLATVRTDLAAGVSVTPSIAVSADGLDWGVYPDTAQIFAGGFQYVGISLDYLSDGKGIARIDELRVKLDMKLRSDAGRGYADAGDGDGTWVEFNFEFLDIRSITVSPAGTSARYAVYDFQDVPYPEGFAVYLFDMAGNRVSGDFSWGVKGV